MGTNNANWFEEENEIDVVEEANKLNENQEEKETPESQTENQKEGQEAPKEEEKKPAEAQKTEDIPFHKHPRFKAVIEEKNQLAEQVKQLTEQVQGVASKITDNEPTTIPKWFVKLYGDDPEVWTQYQEQRQFELQEMESQVMSKLAPKLQEIEKSEKDKAVDLEIENSLKALEDEGHKFDRNALMKVVADNQLFDINGNLNFKAGLSILQASPQQSPKSNVEAKKEIAKKTMSETAAGGETPKKEYATSTDVQNKDWRSFFNKL